MSGGISPKNPLSGSTIEILARAIHNDYVRRKREQGGTSADAELGSWEELPETLRHSNRAQAMDIERKLAAVGLELVTTADGDADSVQFTEPEVRYLARLEHERWCAERIRDGWRLGPSGDAKRKQSPYLVAWDSLPGDVRNLDRDAVRGIPGFVALAGLTMHRVKGRPTRYARP
jgi:RyR domain-containing protein